MAEAKTKTGRSHLQNRTFTKEKDLKNGLYSHSNPPKVVDQSGGVGSAAIKEYIRNGNIQALEELVLQGQGSRLINQSSTDRKVRAFLRTVPSYMSKIDLIHEAAASGNLRELKAFLDRKKLARSKDAQGVGLLHKAVLHGQLEVVEYLTERYPEATEVRDAKDRTPLHYCAASELSDAMFEHLSNLVPEPNAADTDGKTAADYMGNPSMLKVPRWRGTLQNGRRQRRKKKQDEERKKPQKRSGMNITGANIRIWIHDRDLSKLEKVIWEGQGHRLLTQTSNNNKVRNFLNLVPKMMAKIKEVHEAAVQGNVEVLAAKVDQPEILTAKDANGLNPLHKAAAAGQKEACEWILQQNKEALSAPDHNGRIPAHFAAVQTDGGDIYTYLLENGSSRDNVDKFGKTPDEYRGRPGDIDLTDVLRSPMAPRTDAFFQVQDSTTDSPRPQNPKARMRARELNTRFENLKRPKKKDAGKRKERTDKAEESLHENPAKKANLVSRAQEATAEEVEDFLKDGDIDNLEALVLAGRGAELRNHKTWNEEGRRFLKRLPTYMSKIKDFHEAASTGESAAVRQMVLHNPKLPLARGESQAVALHFAAKALDQKTVQQLLSSYPEVIGIEDKNGRTPLHYAAMAGGQGSKEMLSYLQSRGGDAERKDLDGKTPNDYLKTWPQPEPPRSRSRTPSKRAVKSEDKSKSRLFISSKRSSEGKIIDQAIADAEKENFEGIVSIMTEGNGKWLLGKKSSDKEVQRFLDKLPKELAEIEDLHSAAEDGELRKVKNALTLKKRALVKDSNKLTILHKAVLNGHTDVVRYLVTNFPNLLQETDGEGRSAMHYAAVIRDGGHIYKVMQKAGGDSGLPDKSGKTPEEYLNKKDLLSQWDLQTQLQNNEKEPAVKEKASQRRSPFIRRTDKTRPRVPYKAVKKKNLARPNSIHGY